MKKLLVLVAALAVMATGVQAGPLADATADTLWGVELGGYLDVSYVYNFNDPDFDTFGAQDVNFGRAFDSDDDEFNINAFHLYIDRLPEEVGEAGFRVDFSVGEDKDWFAFDQFDGDDFTMYQAYISYIAPVGNGLTIDLGRFVTPLGYEVIESPANDNFSRSLLFTYAIPYTTTGLRFTYPINDQFEVLASVNQGWDEVEDDNDSLSYLAAVRWTPMEALYIQNAISYGPENHWFVDADFDWNSISSDSDYTFLYDLVVSYTAMEQMTVGANFDWATQERGDAIEDAAGADLDSAEWWGLAGYLRYDFSEQLYAAGRAEFVNDDGGARTGFTGTDVDVWEITATLGYEITEGLEARVEFRHDNSDEEIFLDEDGFEDTQNTIAAEVIYSF